MSDLRRYTPGALLVLAGAILAGCPLPFQYTRTGWAGNASAADPSTPDISTTPYVTYSQSSGNGGTLQSGQSATTSSNTTLSIATDTTGAVIYYTTNGTTPDPRSSTTFEYTSPISLAIASPSPSDSSASITLNAAAIGPNMKPSPVMANVVVTVQYPQAAAPVFSPAGGAYASDQSLVMTDATPGAVIYYTLVNGTGPAPAPTPG